MDSATALREFLEYVISQLIDHPEEAAIAHHFERGKHFFRVTLNEEDVGRVIGKSGSTISAIRSLLDAAASNNRERVSLNVGHPGEPGDRDGRAGRR